MPQKINKDKAIREALVIFSAAMRIFKASPKVSASVTVGVLKDINREFTLENYTSFFRGHWNNIPSHTPLGLAAVLLDYARQITQASQHDINPKDKESLAISHDLLNYFSRMKAHCQVIDAQSPKITTAKAIDVLRAKNDEDEAIREMIVSALRGKPGRPAQPRKKARRRRNLHH